MLLVIVNGYIKRGNLSSIQFTNMHLIYCSVRLSSRREEDVVKGVDGWYLYFSQLRALFLSEYMKIWCNIYVITYDRTGEQT